MSSLHRGSPAGDGDGPAGPPLPPVPAARAVVDCAAYLHGRRQRGFSDFHQAYEHVREAGEGFVWLGLHAPTDAQMASVAEVFGLHPLAVEDVVHAHQRPKLELYDGTVFLVLRSMQYIEHDRQDRANDVVDGGEIMILAGRDFVITVRHGDHTQLAGVRARLEARPDSMALGPGAVVHAIADFVVDSYLTVVTDMQSDVDEVEERVFTAATRDLDIDVVYLFKREVLELRRAVAPLAGPLAWLSGHDGQPGANPRGERSVSFQEKEIRRHFRDVADHLSTVNDMVVEYDERLTSLLHAAATKVGIQQNTDMRKISSWAAIAAVPTMVAGLYGMNFEFIPELEWRWSYPVLLILLAAACLNLWRLLHKNRWL
ncbi:magnesium and cobalt transport protein CorA [Gordonia caeni]|uniref:Magnesium/cobalt transporter CorA n=1 Tax=Gordonia caeni TaxID=1007097 RepID=A0ABP7P9E7_9ACTN